MTIAKEDIHFPGLMAGAILATHGEARVSLNCWGRRRGYGWDQQAPNGPPQCPQQKESECHASSESG